MYNLFDRSIEQILQGLYDSEINARIDWFWDAGVDWKLGSEYCGFVAVGTENTIREAVEALAKAAFEHYPQSDFTKAYINKSSDAAHAN